MYNENCLRTCPTSFIFFFSKMPIDIEVSGGRYCVHLLELA